MLAGLETSEEDHHLYPGTIIASFIRWTLGITINIEVNHHTTSIIHTTLHDARVHGQHTPKAPTFRLQPIQPQPNLHEIQQPKLLVVPRGRHPPRIVSSKEQASHRFGERERKGSSRMDSHSIEVGFQTHHSGLLLIGIIINKIESNVVEQLSKMPAFLCCDSSWLWSRTLGHDGCSFSSWSRCAFSDGIGASLLSPPRGSEWEHELSCCSQLGFTRSC